MRAFGAEREDSVSMAATVAKVGARSRADALPILQRRQNCSAPDNLVPGSEVLVRSHSFALPGLQVNRYAKQHTARDQIEDGAIIATIVDK